YAFSGLRAGTYTVQISGFDEEDVAFGSTQKSPTVAVGESKVETFEGTYLRASAITGQVTIGENNNPLEGVTVSLQGKGEDRTETTNGAGQFTFSELRRGDYSVGITNPDIDEYSFDVTSKTITVAHGETGEAYFNGILLRTATIIGTVTVEGVGGIPDVTVTIQGGERGQELTETTNAAGQFRFTDLYAGDYSVGISGFDDDLYGFDVTTGTVTVERKATATVKPFEGIELRTAGIEGTITVDGGHPLPGVTVTVTGGPKDEEHTRVTNDAGYYMVDELHAGVYTVAISDYDTNEYEFEGTTRTIDVGLRTTATVAFQGDLLRTGGISGRVSVAGTLGLDGIKVTLSGDADGEMMTADGGQYAFSGLAEGDYAVEIEGWDDDLYAFETAMMERHVAQDASEIVNFDGTHRENNTISGMMFIDEVMVDGMMTTGEPPFAIPAEALPEGVTGIPLLLQGPGVNDVRFGFSMPDGSYSFGDLVAGSYRVLVNETEDVTKLLAGTGFDFTGEATGAVVSVAGGKEEKVNFPFRITMQTISVGAVMGNDEETGAAVEDVSLAMYPTVQDAENGTNMLGEASKTGEDGMATFHFMRAKDTGPDNGPIDHLVFVKVANTGHDDLAVSANNIIEVEYPSIARASGAPTAVRLLNTAVHFQWWVKSNADAVDGDAALEGWKVVMGTDTIATDAEGKATYSGSVDVADVPATMSVMLDTIQADSLTAGEMWKQSDALKYTQNPLLLPADNTAEDNDLGALRVTWTTQTLVVGVYREMDDIVGYKPHTSHRREDDARPNARVAAKMDVQILEENDRGRWV
ncbi:MAG: carboxypeptidase regulatory-like domain-containing protein, partial [Gemmatimonadetes bacterium]|nr:carboxypeptidase regulatory-like domain-containing protein [Gemmatimonadota bacterium]